MSDELFNDAFYDEFAEDTGFNGVNAINNQLAQSIIGHAKNWISRDLTVEQIGLEIVNGQTMFNVGQKSFSFSNEEFMKLSKDLLSLYDNQSKDYLREFIIAMDGGNLKKVNEAYGFIYKSTNTRRDMREVDQTSDFIDKFLGRFISYMNEENLNHAIELLVFSLRKGAEYEHVDF
jgi:hypothetical protein